MNEIIGKSKVSSSAEFKILKDGFEITDDVEGADCFNDYFSSIGNSLANSIPLVDEPLSKFLRQGQASSLLWTKCIFSYLLPQSSSSTGTNGISIKVPKVACPNLVLPLTFICNLSLSTGIVPVPLKEARYFLYLKPAIQFQFIFHIKNHKNHTIKFQQEGGGEL